MNLAVPTRVTCQFLFMRVSLVDNLIPRASFLRHYSEAILLFVIESHKRDNFTFAIVSCIDTNSTSLYEKNVKVKF
jgi:hypothetical protein